MSTTVNCHACKNPFDIDAAEWCSCEKYLVPGAVGCGCRSVGECNHHERVLTTKVCPRCGACACSRFGEWAERGRIVASGADGVRWDHLDVDAERRRSAP